MLTLPQTDLHAVDSAIQGQTPVVMVPHKSPLPPLSVGRCRFLAGRDGFYVESRTRALHVIVQVASVSLPFGRVDAKSELASGVIPQEMVAHITNKAVLSCPDEFAAMIWRDPATGEYRIWTPPLAGYESNPHRVTYARPDVDPLDIVLDIHSHGRSRAFFSSQDDRDDRSNDCPAFFASVIGTCADAETATFVSRLVVNGRFFNLPWHPWG